MAILAGGVFLVFTIGPGCQRYDSPNSIDDVPVEERITLPSLQAPVDVVRDHLGRPHIYATSLHDLALATGWVHASDRFLQMDLSRRFATGRLAELVGAIDPEALETDKRMRAVGIAGIADAAALTLGENSMTGEALVAYSEGVNAWLAINGPRDPEYALFGYPVDDIPSWTPADSLAVAKLYSFVLGFGADGEVDRAEWLTDFGRAFPPGDARNGIARDLLLSFAPLVDEPVVPLSVGTSLLAVPRSRALPLRAGRGLRVSSVPLKAAGRFFRDLSRDPRNPLGPPGSGASNAWVVAAERTAGGGALLANDPHLQLQVPAVWYELHWNTTLRGGGSVETSGVSLPGAPAILIGANQEFGWGLTNTGADTTDVYIERYSVGTGTGGVDQVEFDADGPGGVPPSLVDLIQEEHEIEVRNGPASITRVTEIVWRVPHRNDGRSAIVPESLVGSTAMSWAWTGFDGADEVYGALLLDTLPTVDPLLLGAPMLFIQPQNLLYVAEGGSRIGYTMVGSVPVRDDDDGDLTTDPPWLPVPGWDGAHEWIGSLDALPAFENPAQGWIASSNQDPTGATADGDPTNDAQYLGYGFDPGFRAGRIAARLDGASDATSADMASLQGDYVSNLAVRLLPSLLPEVALDAPHRALLDDWLTRGCLAASAAEEDASAAERKDAAATALFNVWLDAIVERTFADEIEAARTDDERKIGGGAQVKTLVRMLEDPASTATYSVSIGDSVLWDDLGTAAAETRTDVIRSAFAAARSWLASADGFLSNDPDDWRWGRLHTLRLRRITGLPALAVPPGEPFPRRGDLFNVDASNHAIGEFEYTYGFGASMRWVLELEPGGRRRIRNSLPGGSSADPFSGHYADQAYGYAENRNFATWHLERDVARKAERRDVLEP